MIVGVSQIHGEWAFGTRNPLQQRGAVWVCIAAVGNQQPVQHIKSVGLVGTEEVSKDRRERFGVGIGIDACGCG